MEKIVFKTDFEILKRKLEIVEKNYRTSQREYEFYAVLAICSIYGIELLKDKNSIEVY